MIMKKLSKITLDPEIEEWDRLYEEGRLRLPSLSVKLERRFGSEAKDRILTRIRKGMWVVTAVYSEPELFENSKGRNPMTYWYAGQLKSGGILVFSSPKDYRMDQTAKRSARKKYEWLSLPYESQKEAAEFLMSKVKFKSNAPATYKVLHEGTIKVQHISDPKALSFRKAQAKKKKPAAKKKTTKRKNPADKEYTSYSSWYRAVKKMYPTARTQTFDSIERLIWAFVKRKGKDVRVAEFNVDQQIGVVVGKNPRKKKRVLGTRKKVSIKSLTRGMTKVDNTEFLRIVIANKWKAKRAFGDDYYLNTYTDKKGKKQAVSFGGDVLPDEQYIRTKYVTNPMMRHQREPEKVLTTKQTITKYKKALKEIDKDIKYIEKSGQKRGMSYRSLVAERKKVVKAIAKLSKNPRITKLSAGERIDEQLRKLKEELLYKHGRYFKHGKKKQNAQTFAGFISKDVANLEDMIAEYEQKSLDATTNRSRTAYRRLAEQKKRMLRDRLKTLLKMRVNPKYVMQNPRASERMKKSRKTGVSWKRFKTKKTWERNVKKYFPEAVYQGDPKGNIMVTFAMNKDNIVGAWNSHMKQGYVVTIMKDGELINPPKEWHKEQLDALEEQNAHWEDREKLAGRIAQEKRAVDWHKDNPPEEVPATPSHAPLEPSEEPGTIVTAPGTDSSDMTESITGKTGRPSREGKRVRHKRQRIRKITRRLKRAKSKGRSPERLSEIKSRLARVQIRLKKAQEERAERGSMGRSSVGRAKKRTKGIRKPKMKRSLSGEMITKAEWKTRRKTRKVARKAARKTRRGLHKPKTRGSKVYQRRADYTKRLAIGRKTGGFGVGRRVSRGRGGRAVMKNNPPTKSGRYVVLELNHKDLKKADKQIHGPFTHEKAIDALPHLKRMYKGMGFSVLYARVH